MTVTSGSLRIDHGRMLEMIALEGQLLLEATRSGRPELPTPGASGRTLAGTVRHLDHVCRDALGWLRSEESPGIRRQPADGEGLCESCERLATGLAVLLAELGTRDPRAPCATWWPRDHTVGFWTRRVLHETTVHRVDAQSAVGMMADAIETDVAVDGADEALQLWFQHRLTVLGVTGSGRYSVGLTVNGADWCADAGPDGVRVRSSARGERGHTDAWISGDPSAVYLWLWGRLPDRAITTEGDHDAVAQLWGLLRLATR